ncbi:MAG: cupin domain-containing protein [Dehalococcoidia bacterium]
MSLHRSNVSDLGVLAEDETFRLESLKLPVNESSGIVSSDGDVVVLILSGEGSVTTSDRKFDLTDTSQFHVPASKRFELHAGAQDLHYLLATCPAGELRSNQEHDSGFVRGGMFYLDECRTASYHSHDSAAEVFVFLKGQCRAKVDGVSEDIGPREVLHVPAEEKHELKNIGNSLLEVWLTVTPNVSPSRMFYEEQADVTWVRVTPRVDGQESRPPSA